LTATNGGTVNLYAVWEAQKVTISPKATKPWTQIFGPHGNYSSLEVNAVNGHKYYIVSEGGDYGDANGYGPIWSDAFGFSLLNNASDSRNSRMTKVDNIYAYAGNTGTVYIYARYDNHDDDITGNYYVWHYCYVYDLTEAFGAGNEPSLATCQKYLSRGGTVTIDMANP
jgi:hypothetical protein